MRKLVIELGPLLLFFLVNWQAGIFAATAAFMAAMVAAIAYSWHATRHVAPMLWVSTALVLVFGSLTLWLQDATFIKIKPTVIYAFFAIVLYAGMRTGRLFLRTLFDQAFPAMEDRGWQVLTRNWALFFLALAVLNEIVWRHVSTDGWVAFKTFAVLPLTFVFALSQIPLVSRHQRPEEPDAD
ncbi:MAG: septation protein A [Rhodothalassiaceae bacterium]